MVERSNEHNHKKKIAFLLTSLEMGGIERTTVNLAIGLEAHGFQVEMFVIDTRGELINQIPSTIRLIESNANTFSSIGIMSHLIEFVKYIRSNRPTAIITERSSENFLSICALLLSRIDTTLIIRENGFHSPAGQTMVGPKATFLRYSSKLTYNFADHIIAVSRGVQNDLQNHLILPNKQVKLIHNCVVTDKLIEQSNEDVSNRWFLDPNIEVVLSAGRLVRAKGFDTLVKAFELLHNKRKVRLVILGDGPQRSKLEDLIHSYELSDKVILPGTVSNPYKYMSKASVFVLSSLREGLPTVLVEALACGCPVVSTSCKHGPVEILRDGRYGELVPVNDKFALANGIERSLNNPPSPAILRRRSRDFSAEAIVPEYVRLL